MQRILSLVRRCVEDYHMIDEGDTVAGQGLGADPGRPGKAAGLLPEAI